MGLFLGWPIHRARGAPEEAPVLGQRQAGAACFPRQSTNAPERGAWRPWRAQPAPVQPSPAAAAPSPPPGPPPRQAPGPRGPTPSAPNWGRRPLLAHAPRTACWPRAPRPTLRALQTSVLARLLLPFLSPSPLLLLLLPLAVPSSSLHLSPSFSLILLTPSSYSHLRPPFLSSPPSSPFSPHCSSSLPLGCRLRCAPVPQCPPHLTVSDSPPGSEPSGLSLGERRMVLEGRVLSSLLGLALLWFPLDSHARVRK